MQRAFPAASITLLVLAMGCSDEADTNEASNGAGGAMATGGALVTGGSTGAGGGAASGGLSSGGSAPGSGGTSGSGGSGGIATDTGGALGTGGDDGAGGLLVNPPPPAVMKASESLLTSDGLTVVSYGGYLNGESFQQDGIVTYGGKQYAAFWNAERHVVLAARTLPGGAWSYLELSDYSNQADDAHNTISIGVAPGDKTLHLSFDHHDDVLNYRRSEVGFLDTAPQNMEASQFGPILESLGGGVVQPVTYPRFITAPDGESLLLSLRLGASGSGTAHLFEYQTSNGGWTPLGQYLDGATFDENPYFHGISFGPNGDRLHFAWCARATPDATTNHDLFYVYSDDAGRTFKNSAGELVGTVGSDPVEVANEGVRVWEISQNRGLINQEHMVVDDEGAVHVLLSHMPDEQGTDANFTSARTKSEFFHYYRSPEGTWTRTALGAFAVENFRGSLALSQSGNLYAVLPNLRIYAAARSEGYFSFTLLETDSRGFFSDPLVDRTRLLLDGVLSIAYPMQNSGEIYVLDYEVD